MVIWVVAAAVSGLGLPASGAALFGDALSGDALFGGTLMVTVMGVGVDRIATRVPGVLISEGCSKVQPLVDNCSR